MSKTLHVKYFLFFFSCLCTASAFSQITITRSDFANVGDMVITAHDTVPVALPGNPGPSQSWDLSGIANHFADTVNFVNPGSTPYAANFPTANLAGHNSTDNSYYYLNASTGSIEITGYVAMNPFTGNPQPLQFSPPQTQTTFPSTAATAFANTSVASSGGFYMHLVLDSSTNTVADSFRITLTTIRNSLVDGWGSVSTPAGTFNVLRQHILDSTNTLIEAYVSVGGFPVGWQTMPFGGNDVTHDYYYLANNQKWAVAQVTTDDIGTVTAAQYMVNAVIGIDEHFFSGSSDVLLYPNPSNGNINISVLTDRATAIEVYDMLGRRTETISLANGSVNHSFELSAKGIYSFRVIGKNGESISNGKFILEK
jgi:hypothetical protein